MKTITTPINDVYVFEPEIYKDNRGYFFESYNKDLFVKNGIRVMNDSQMQ